MRFLPIAFLLFSLLPLTAQNLELGFWGGTALYQGDFSPKEISDGISLYTDGLELAGGLFLRLNPAKPISLELGLNLGRVSGADGVTNNTPNRMLNFRSPITELALKADIHLFRAGNPRGMQFVPYLMVGASVFRFKPEAEFDGNFIELQPLGTEAQGAIGYEDPYSLTNFAILTGGGLKFIFKERFTIGLELGARKTFTDHLDDVSGVTVNYLDVLENNGSLAAQLSNPRITDPEAGDVNYRRGGEFEDWFFMGGLSFSFAFGEGSGVNGKGIGCPTF